MKQVEQVEQKTEQNLGWIKSLLNNMPLLRWVRKFSADNLLSETEHNSISQRFGLKTTEESIAVPDKTLTKVLFTHSRYNGEEYTRFNLKQIGELIQVLGNEGEMIIRNSTDREMVIQIKDTSVVICPIISDKKK